MSEALAPGQGRSLPRPNNMFTIPFGSEKEFFKWWCTFLKPFVKLTAREIDVMSSFLKMRYDLSKKISDPAILDSHLMNDDTKKMVMEECHITLKHFYVIMNSLRKKKIIVNNVIEPLLVPNTKNMERGIFPLLILFKGKLE
jgi:hypothetical protein